MRRMRPTGNRWNHELRGDAAFGGLKYIFTGPICFFGGLPLSRGDPELDPSLLVPSLASLPPPRHAHGGLSRSHVGGPGCRMPDDYSMSRRFFRGDDHDLPNTPVGLGDYIDPFSITQMYKQVKLGKHAAPVDDFASRLKAV